MLSSLVKCLRAVGSFGLILGLAETRGHDTYPRSPTNRLPAFVEPSICELEKPGREKPGTEKPGQTEIALMEQRLVWRLLQGAPL
jgi:hypothetical protein